MTVGIGAGRMGRQLPGGARRVAKCWSQGPGKVQRQHRTPRAPGPARRPGSGSRRCRPRRGGRRPGSRGAHEVVGGREQGRAGGFDLKVPGPKVRAGTFRAEARATFQPKSPAGPRWPSRRSYREYGCRRHHTRPSTIRIPRCSRAFNSLHMQSNYRLSLLHILTCLVQTFRFTDHHRSMNALDVHMSGRATHLPSRCLHLRATPPSPHRRPRTKGSDPSMAGHLLPRSTPLRAILPTAVLARCSGVTG